MLLIAISSFVMGILSLAMDKFKKVNGLTIASDVLTILTPLLIFMIFVGLMLLITNIIVSSIGVHKISKIKNKNHKILEKTTK